MPVKIFFCYAREDRKMLVQLQKHLKPLQQHGYIDTWYDQDISAGTEWEPEIARRLHAAQIILLLVSADFINSEHSYNKEMKWALERHQRGEARVIPIILRDVLWQYGPFSKLQPLPSDAKPIYRWTHKDEAYKNITEGIARVIEELFLPSLQKSTTQISRATSPQQKRALLILTGGTVLPDILLLLHYRPQLVCVVVPRNWPFQRTYADIVQALPSCEIKILPPIDPYDIDACLQACLDSYLPYAYEAFEWVLTATSATKVMTLAGYEFAKQNRICSWNIDPNQEQIVMVGTQMQADIRKFFHPTVAEYLQGYGYTIIEPSLAVKAYRERAEAWSGVVRDIVQSSEAQPLLSLLINKNKEEPITIPAILRTIPPFASLISTNMLELTQEHDNGTATYCFPSADIAHFFRSGDWLSLYVWHEIRREETADDCLWACDITRNQAHLNLDLILTYRARLLLVECKTGQNPYHLESLSLLEWIANSLGRSYVSRILITSSANTQRQSFYEHAQLRSTVVATWEDLPNIGSIIKRTLLAPTYIRA